MMLRIHGLLHANQPLRNRRHLQSLRLRSLGLWRHRLLRTRLLQQSLVADLLLPVELAVHFVQAIHHVPCLALVDSPQASAPYQTLQLVGDQLQRDRPIFLDTLRNAFSTPSKHSAHASCACSRLRPERPRPQRRLRTAQPSGLRQARPPSPRPPQPSW